MCVSIMCIKMVNWLLLEETPTTLQMLAFYSLSEILFWFVWEDGFTWARFEKPTFVTNWISIFCCLLLNISRVAFFDEHWNLYLSWIFFEITSTITGKKPPGLSTVCRSSMFKLNVESKGLGQRKWLFPDHLEVSKHNHKNCNKVFFSFHR